ncbi:MAG: radical SAM protein [Bacteroidetes bacterium]|nr:radical SAM protein [Bacteroidota bacterium]
MFNEITDIEFDIQESCNLRCTYCYLQSGEKKGNKIFTKSIFDCFFDKYKKTINKDKKINISFWGGEPLINFDLIEYIVTKFSSFKGINFLVVTNGTLINKKIALFCKSNNVRLQISLDGNEKTHNSLRKDKKGRATYDKILSNIELCKSLGTEYSILTNLTKVSENPSSIIKEYHDKRIKSPYFNVVNPTTSENYKYLYPLDSKHVVADLIADFKKNFKYDIKKALLDYPNILYSIKRLFASNQRTSCGLDKSRIAIKYDGTIYPCRRMIDRPDMCIGNVWDGITEKYNNMYHRVIDLNKNCKICEYKFFCGGPCFFEILSRNNINYIQKDYCIFVKELYFETLKIMTKIFFNNADKYKAISGLFNMVILKDKIRFAMTSAISPDCIFIKLPKLNIIDLGSEGIIYNQSDFDKKHIANITAMCILDLIDGKRTAINIAKEIATICNIKYDDIKEDVYMQLSAFLDFGFIEEAKYVVR